MGQDFLKKQTLQYFIYFKSASSLSLYWDWAFVEFALEAAKEQFFRTKKQLRTKWNK